MIETLLIAFGFFFAAVILFGITVQLIQLLGLPGVLIVSAFLALTIAARRRNRRANGSGSR